MKINSLYLFVEHRTFVLNQKYLKNFCFENFKYETYSRNLSPKEINSPRLIQASAF